MTSPSITPKSSSNKLQITINAHVGADSGTDSRWWGLRLYQSVNGASYSWITDAGGNSSSTGTNVWTSANWGADTAGYNQMVANTSATYILSPGNTLPRVFRVYGNPRIGGAGNGTLYLNRANSQGDAYRALQSSYILVEEIRDL